MLISMATPRRVVARPRSSSSFSILRPSPCVPSKGHPPRSHPPSSSSRHYALLNQSCHRYCCLLAIILLPTPPSIPASFASSTSSRFRFRSGCQTGPLGVVVAQPVRGSLWILLIKQHRLRCCGADKAATDRRYSRAYLSVRGLTSVENPGTATLSNEARGEGRITVF